MKPINSTFQAFVIASVALLASLPWTRAAQLMPSTDWIAPPEAASRANPVAADSQSINRGRQLYELGCLPCHGTKGAGDGPAASALERHPGILSDPSLWQQTDGALFWKSSEGRSPMPSFADAFTEAQRWDIINFVRTLAPKPAGGAIAPPDSVQASRLAKPTQQGDTAGLGEELRSLKKAVSDLKSGTTKSLISGYAFAGYTDQEGGSSFNAGFNPIFLWQPAESLFFESELELGLEDGETDLNLEYAHLSYLLNDYVTIGAGKFLTPFGIFRERLHPAWINKLPDAPMAFSHHGLIPPSVLGAQLRGGFPVGPTKLNYSLYLGNGPTLNVGADEPEESGLLHFDNFDNFRDNKAAGARVGLLPIPELEIGYSGQYASVDATATSRRRADAWLHGPYLSYARDSDLLRGAIDVKAEWVWSRVDRLTYDPNGSLGFGPLTFDNNRNGGYAQLAYRPSKVSIHFLQNLEAVFRFDRLDRPSAAPEAADASRYTLGLNYWLTPRVVFKGAYQFGDRKEPGDDSQSINAILLQAAMGF